MTNKRCKNCDNEVQHQYCAHCGQKTSVESLTISRLFQQLSDNVFQVNHGLFYSIKEFSFRPALGIKCYLNGQRKQYFQPIAYAFTLTSLFFVLTKVIGHSTFVDQVFEGYTLGADDKDTGMSNEFVKLIEWLKSNYAYTTLVLVPMYALATRLAFYRGGYNYLEHIVLNLYITGHQSLIYGLSAVAGLFIKSEDVVEIITLVLSMSYAMFVLIQFFDKSRMVFRIIKGLFSYLVSLIFLSFMLGIAVIATS